jgi:hypothetical protein
MPGERGDKGGRGGPTPENDFADRMRGELGREHDGERKYFQTDPRFQDFVNALDRLENAVPQEKEKRREVVAQQWERVMHAQLRKIDKLLDGKLLRFINAVPYEVRDPEFFYESINEGIDLVEGEKWAGEETKAWLKRIEIDLAWGAGNLGLCEGMSGVVDKMYDGEEMLRWIKERFRSDPVERFYEFTFAEKIPGLELEDDERRALGEAADVGLREKAVKFQDDYSWARITGAAVAQHDYDNPADPDRLGRKLTPEEIAFFQAVLRRKIPKGGDWTTYKGTTVPREMLNWNSMDSVEAYKRRYLATMQAILLTGARDRLVQLTGRGGDNPLEAEEMKQLIADVQGGAGDILSRFFSRKTDLDTHLSAIVVKSGIVFDWGHFCSGPMSWAYKYNKKGERSVALGPTFAATDSNTPHYLLWNILSTMSKSWPGGAFLEATAQYRKDAKNRQPNWKPKFEKPGLDEQGKPIMKAVSPDEFGSDLKIAWDELWGGNWDPKAREWLQNEVWRYDTKYGSIPIFMPREFASLNFWNTISLKEAGASCKLKLSEQIKEEAKDKIDPDDKTPTYDSLWDELRAGGKLSSVDWANMGDQAFNRWLITLGQFGRIFSVIKEPSGEMAYELLSSPKNLSLWIKRVDLGTRDERIPGPVMIMTIAPFLVAIKLARDHSLFGYWGANQKNREDWVEDIAKWTVAFEGLVDERTGYKNYGWSMAKLLVFYSTILGGIAARTGSAEKTMATDRYNLIAQQLGKVGASVQRRTVAS